ncbi:efflux RND transporter periplasmic adaptor subunit [Nannocystaceae bacterium ST9]
MFFRPTALLLALLVPTLSGCGQAPEPAAPQEQPPAPVEVAKAEVGVLTEDWVFVGQVRSLRAAELAPGAGGEVIMIEVREGDRVEVGQVLVELDERAAKARLRAARSSQRESDRELAQALRDAKRVQSLGGAIVPEAEIERETSRADTLEARKRRYGAEVEAVRAEIDDHRIVAPFTGVIATRLVDLGQWVDPGETVLELISVDEVELLVDVRPELVAHLRVGGKASVRPPTSVGGRTRDSVGAEVLGVVPSLDPSTRTVKVRLAPSEPRAWLMPGASVDVAFPVALDTATASDPEAGDAVIVPRDALVLGAVDTRVLEVVEGAAKPIQVEVLASAGERALVRGPGLRAGAVVVTRGNERLRPGQSVRVLAPEPAKEPAS